MDLPIAASCDLDAEALRTQRARYRQAGNGATVVERTARSLIVTVTSQGASVVPELIDVERQCCPFFDLAWEEERHTFSVAVSDREHEPALDAIAFALGI